MAKYPFIFPFDPEKLVASDISETISGLRDGMHQVAEHEGVTLWTEIRGGLPADFRAFGPAQEELAVIIFKPAPEVDYSAEPPPPPQLPRDGCGYVCAATGDGGYICWFQCPGKDGGT
jgi:hypothetical protein